MQGSIIYVPQGYQMKDVMMGGACSTYAEGEKWVKFLSENQKEGYHL